MPRGTDACPIGNPRVHCFRVVAGAKTFNVWGCQSHNLSSAQAAYVLLLSCHCHFSSLALSPSAPPNLNHTVQLEASTATTFFLSLCPLGNILPTIETITTIMEYIARQPKQISEQLRSVTARTLFCDRPQHVLSQAGRAKSIP
jgi:hypothetical protein